MSSSNPAFVKVVEAEIPGRLPGQKKLQLFYRACRTDYDGKLWDLCDPTSYPYHWGFSEISNALAVVRNHNRATADEDGETWYQTSDVIARKLADEEREAALDEDTILAFRKAAAQRGDDIQLALATIALTPNTAQRLPGSVALVTTLEAKKRIAKLLEEAGSLAFTRGA